MKVLVADDESVSRRLLESAIFKFGYSVVSVQDGESAWAALHEGPESPRLAVLDWNMPGLDGPTLCKQLRQQPPAAYVYTVLLTSRDSSGDMVIGLDSGADDYLVKPFDPGVLRARLKAGERMVRLQSQNEQSRAYLAAAVDQIDSGVMLLDASGRIRLINGVLATMAGVAAGAAVGMGRAELLSRLSARATDADTSASWAQQLQVPEGSFERRQVELELLLPEPAGRRIIQWSVAPVSLPEGRGSLETFRDVTAEVESVRERERRALTDPVTGLTSRRGGEEILASLVEVAKASGTPLSVAMLDIDRFKLFNDTYGHDAGDQVLRAVSRTVQSTVRGSDVVIRWGGEEILIALPKAQRGHAIKLAERIRSAVEALVIEPFPRVTASIGVDELETGEDDLLNALRRADKRLYQAKAEGRNRVC